MDDNKYFDTQEKRVEFWKKLCAICDEIQLHNALQYFFSKTSINEIIVLFQQLNDLVYILQKYESRCEILLECIQALDELKKYEQSGLAVLSRKDYDRKVKGIHQAFKDVKPYLSVKVDLNIPQYPSVTIYQLLQYLQGTINKHDADNIIDNLNTAERNPKEPKEYKEGIDILKGLITTIENSINDNRHVNKDVDLAFLQDIKTAIFDKNMIPRIDK